MKRELRDKWVAALRSGEYEQGKDGLLAKEFGRYVYCCLGVLQDVADIPFKDKEPGHTLLRSAVAEAVGLPPVLSEEDTPFAEVQGGGVQKALADMNWESDFPTIAAWIETYIPVED